MKEAEEEKQFLVHSDIRLAGIIKKTMPKQDGYKGQIVIYLQKFSTNKSDDYECIYKSKYLFCKIKGHNALILGDDQMAPGDSVYYNTAELKYQVFSHGKLNIENGTSIEMSDSFFESMRLKGYLDVDYYQKNQGF